MMRYSLLSNTRSLSPRGFVLFLLVFLASFSISCENDSNPAVPAVVPPAEFRHATFPLAPGNEWAYVDSMLEMPDGPTLMTMKITAYAAGWWNIDWNSGVSFGLMSRNDTILRIGPYESSPEVEYIPNPPIGDTVVITRTLYGYPYAVRVYSLAHSVTTPAGTFDSCAIYEHYLTPRVRYVDYFRPGIGLIAWEYSSGEDTLRPFDRGKLVFLKLTR